MNTRLNNTSDNFRGAVLMSISMIGFTLNDTMIKLAAADLSLFQAIFIRGLFTTFLIAIIAWHQKALFCRVSASDWKIIAWRGFGDVCATLCFLTALFNMPIANATAILQALPLAVTLGAAWFLGDVVGWRRYGAIAIGFIGVMVIVRPGSEGFNVYSFGAIGAVFFVVIRDLSTRKLSAKVPSIFVALINAATITIAGGLLSPTMEWHPVETHSIIKLMAAGFFLVFGYVFGVMTMRVGEISFVSPFRYTALIWAIIIGILVFGEIPDRWTIIGSAIVVVMGIYTFYRERQILKRNSAG